MTKKLALQAEDRKGKARAIVRSGFIPAVIYGHSFATIPFQIESRAFKKILHEAGTTSLITLKIGKDEHQVLIREVQSHPVRGEVVHVDFYLVRMDEVIKAEVPIVIEGVAPAVKELSGILLRNMDAVELEALPKDLPHQITVDVSSLTDFEKVIHVKDLSVPAGVKLLSDLEAVVILVQPPRSEAELEKLSEEVKEDVTAVEGVIKPEKPAEGEEAKEGEAGAKDEKKEKPEKKKE